MPSDNGCSRPQTNDIHAAGAESGVIVWPGADCYLKANTTQKS